MEPSELGTEPIRVRVGSPSRRGRRPSSRTPSEITEDDGGIPRRQIPERVVIPRSRSPTIVRVPPEASIECTPSAGRVRREETQRRPHKSPHQGMVSGNSDYGDH